MIRTRILTGMLLAAMGLPLFASEPASPSEEVRVTSTDFISLAGDGWSGSLRYLDYSSNTEKRIPVEIRFDNPGTRKLDYRIKYPGETQYNTKERLKWSRDGRRLNGRTIVSRDRQADGTLVLITQYEGKDDNRSAEIRMSTLSTQRH